MAYVWRLDLKKNLCLWVISVIIISGWAEPITFFYVRGISFMAFEDKDLVCKDCGATFIFTVGEQEFYAEKGFENEPQRCRECRNIRKTNRNSQEGRSREMFTVVCADCGVETQVPFQPTSDRPVYCRECYQHHRPAREQY